MASGKGTLTKYLSKKYNASTHRFSTMLRDVLSRIYLDHSRENMQKISTALRRNYGEDTLARVMAEDVRKDNAEMIVIDGVRRLDDIKYLKKITGFKLVYIEVNKEERYNRIIQRSENPDDKNKTFKKFLTESQNETELQIKGLKKYADVIIDNNGRIENLYKQADSVLKKKYRN